MAHSSIKTGLSALVATASMLAVSTSAFAQVDEIIVTAQKKEQNLQDVPIAIQAFDIESLDKYRIEGLEDVAFATPGVYVTQNPADPNGVRINIRGIGTFDPQIGQDSRIAIYQDGVYQGRTQGLAVDYPDIERMEVLKGPQGTLYGRNTVGGLINIISTTPQYGETGGKVGLEVGNFSHLKVTGAVNLPIGDSVALRLSGLTLGRDGWVKNQGTGADFGGEQKWGGRAALGVELSESMELVIAGDYNKTEKEPLFYQSITDFGAGFLAGTIDTFEGRQEEVTPSFVNEAGDLETKGISAILNMDVADGQNLKITGAYREADSSRFVALVPTANPAALNATAGGFNTVLSGLPTTFATAAANTLDPTYPGALQLRSDFGVEFDGSTPERGLFLSPPGGATNLSDHQQFSLEATMNGSLMDDKLDYTVGAFFYDESTGTGNDPASRSSTNDYLFVLASFGFIPFVPWQQEANDFLAPFAGFLPPGTLPAGPATLTTIYTPFAQSIPSSTPLGAGVQANLENILFGTGLRGAEQCNPASYSTGSVPIVTSTSLFCALSTARQSAANTLFIDTQTFALYGQATYNLTEDLRITGGLRFSDESKDGVGQAKSAFFVDNFDLFGNPIDPNISSYSDSVLDPSVTVEYDIAEDMLVYASYKQAFRAGGFNSAAVGPNLPGETFGSDFNFGREDITAYEVGYKGDINDDFRFNISGFYYDFTNQQTTVALDPLIATSRAVVNTDEEIWGIEADATFALSENITLRGGYSWVDGDAGDVTNPLTGILEVRDELQGTPEHSFLAAVDFVQPLGDNEMFANLTYSYKDEVLSIPQNDLRLPSFALVNGRLGFNLEDFGVEDSPLTVAFWGTNLLDEEYLIDSLPFESFAYRTVVFGQPRSYGVSVGTRF